MYQTVEKRFQMVAEGINISALVVLTPSEQEKLECKDLEKVINGIANDLHVKWAVEINGNVATATISKQFGPVVGESQAHEVEIAATNFMRGVEHLVVPCATKNPEQEKHENAPVKERVISFCVNSNAARIIKAIRECTNATLETAKQYARNGRIVCAPDEVESIVENLEVAGASNVCVDAELTERLNFCKKIIDEWEETDDRCGTAGAIILGSEKGLPGVCIACGTIDEYLLKDMFIAYIQSL